MSSASLNPAEVRSALRAVLRTVDRHITSINGSQQWRREVIARFRAAPQSLPSGSTQAPPSSPISASTREASRGPQSLIEPCAGSSTVPELATNTRPIAPAGCAPTATQALALAREWAALAENIARHKSLLLSYNIGLDVDERTKHMIEATARRVGFALPQTPTGGVGGNGAQAAQPGAAP